MSLLLHQHECYMCGNAYNCEIENCPLEEDDCLCESCEQDLVDDEYEGIDDVPEDEDF